MAAGNSVGLLASSLDGSASELSIEDCLVTHNASVGVSADSNGSGFGKVRISGSTVTNNAVGLQQSGASILESRGANTIEGNGADTSGTVGPFPAK